MSHNIRSELRFTAPLAVTILTLGTGVPGGFAAAPSGHYMVLSETVLDAKTGLMWQRTAPATTFAWNDANEYCSGLDLAGANTGWRLATVKELQTLVDIGQASGAAIDAGAFPATVADFFWSSTPNAHSGGVYAWEVGFHNGQTYNDPVGTPRYARCVRAADCVAPGSPPVCGNGWVCAGVEVCDDGNGADGDYCSADCKTVTGYCGDGTKQSNENCDDGNTNECGTCSADCKAARTVVAAYGDINVGATVLDGETLTIDDGASLPVVFEFDPAGNGVASGHVPIDNYCCVEMGLADKTAQAIANNTLVGTRRDEGAWIHLTHSIPGALGNRAVSETVADPLFVVLGLWGGSARNCATGVRCVSDDDCASGVCVSASATCQ